MNYDDEFDRILDDALIEYRDAEPLAGMEVRVVQRVRLQAQRRRKLWRQWSALAAAAAVLAIAAGIGLTDRLHHQAVPTPPIVQKQNPAVEPQPQPQSSGTLARNHKTLPQPAHAPRSQMSGPAQLASTEYTPKRERFPLLAPLQPEERVLLALAKTHPEALLDQADPDKELAIAPIDIKPLADESSAQQGDN